MPNCVTTLRQSRRVRIKFRGRDRVGWAFALAAAAYNLVRLPKLMAGAADEALSRSGQGLRGSLADTEMDVWGND